MKTLFLLLILFFGLSSVLNTVNAQKISKDCTPKVPFTNWVIAHNSPTGNNIDISKINVNTEPFKEGTDLSNCFKKKAEVGVSSCYLDFFLDNQKLIPTEWQKFSTVIFTGTIFMEDGKYLVYRTMSYDKDKTIWVSGKNYAEFMLQDTHEVYYVN